MCRRCGSTTAGARAAPPGGRWERRSGLSPTITSRKRPWAALRKMASRSNLCPAYSCWRGGGRAAGRGEGWAWAGREHCGSMLQRRQRGTAMPHLHGGGGMPHPNLREHSNACAAAGRHPSQTQRCAARTSAGTRPPSSTSALLPAPRMGARKLSPCRCMACFWCSARKQPLGRCRSAGGGGKGRGGGRQVSSALGGEGSE